MDFRNQGLQQAIDNSLNNQAKLYDVKTFSQTISAKFEELIIELHKQYKRQVVILVDEYDKPITDYLEQKNKK